MVPQLLGVITAVSPKALPPKIKKATPRLAPLLIPKTNGPASGFLKSVCIINPATARPLPVSTAAKAFGIR